MLTSNFSEIIQVVTNKYSTRTLETLSADDIRNISLMLLGYLGLIKSGFKTNEHEPLDTDDYYYQQLKNVLSFLVEAQEKHLNQAKEDLLVQCTQELNSMDDKIQNVLNRITLNHHAPSAKMKRCTLDLKKITQKLKAELQSALNKDIGFHVVLVAYFESYAQVRNLMPILKDNHTLHEMQDCVALFQKSLSFYTNQMLWWESIEKINIECRSYAQNSNLITLWGNG